MKTLFSSILLLFILILPAAAQNSLTFDLTDGRKVIRQNISKDLLLRVVKDSSVTQKDFGWLVEVVRRRTRGTNARNLIYTNKLGVGADPSQVMAWQIDDPVFPRNRRFQVRGFPFVVRISLIEPRATGKASDAKFVSGKLKISWTRREK